MSGWEPERGPENWSDTDAWRGELHLDGDDSWRGETMANWEEEEENAESDSEDDLSASTEQSDWPENLAGPEYWLFKRDEEN